MSVSLNGVPRIITGVGLADFLGRTNDPSLYQVLGIPDVAGKDVYTLLITDRLDDATIGLTKIASDAAAILADTGTAGVVLGTKAATYSRLSGELQLVTNTIDLNQAVDSYDLFTGTTAACYLTSLSIKQPTTVTAGALTSISIQNDDATPGVIISAEDGVVGNLLTESELVWTGRMRVDVGTKIQLSIAGGASGVAQVCQVVAEYVAIADTGYLA